MTRPQLTQTKAKDQLSSVVLSHEAVRKSEVAAEDSGYLLWLHVSVWGSKWICSSLRQINQRSAAATHTSTHSHECVCVCTSPRRNMLPWARPAGIVLVERSGHRERPLSLKAAVSSSEVRRRPRHRLNSRQCFQHIGYKLYVHINTDSPGLITASSSFCMLARTGSSHWSVVSVSDVMSPAVARTGQMAAPWRRSGGLVSGTAADEPPVSSTERWRSRGIAEGRGRRGRYSAFFMKIWGRTKKPEDPVRASMSTRTGSSWHPTVPTVK